MHVPLAVASLLIGEEIGSSDSQHSNGRMKDENLICIEDN